MYKSIKIKNLRAITELAVDNLGQVNLLVGSNNCGKTTVLEALFFLIGATNPQLPLNANRFRGLTAFTSDYWQTFFHNMDIKSPIEICGKISNSNEIETLVIRCHQKKGEVESSRDSDFSDFDRNVTLTQLGTSDSRPSLVPNGLELKYSNSTEPKKKIVSAIFEKDGQIVPEGTKERSILGTFVLPSMQSDLISRFGRVQRKRQEQEIINLLKDIDPLISDLVINEFGLLEADVGLDNRLPINLMGQGIITALAVALAMHDLKDGIVLIDEFDTGFHYSIQEILWKAVFTWAQKLNVQVFATTHSYECIQAFAKHSKNSLFGNEAKLFRIERKPNSFNSVEINSDELNRMLKNMWEVR